MKTAAHQKKMRSMNGNSRRARRSKWKAPITILNVGRMNDDIQQEPQRVDQDVPFATLDLLARVVAKDRAKTPFCGPLAVCVSIMATVGLNSRPSCSRTATYSS